MFCMGTHRHQSMFTYSQPSFPVLPEEKLGMDVQTRQEPLKIEVVTTYY